LYSFWLANRLFQYYCVASVRTDNRGAPPRKKAPRSRERKSRIRALWPYPQYRAERLPRKKRLVRAERDRRKCNKSETGRAIFWRGAIMAETAQLDVGHLLEPEAVAKILGKSRATLARWRCDGFGPAFIKIGGSVAYCPADVEAFIRAQRRLRTTGASGARQVVQQ
jgi:predicted DNA-binding transcriptional regulator AlpA